MNHEIVIPEELTRRLRGHLFQNELEQAGFLFARVARDGSSLRFDVFDCYLVPASGWDVQMDVYLEMSHEERGRILKLARELDAAVIDCHSHPHSTDAVWFSPSDRSGITEFAQYVRWKLNGRPFAALVWGEDSVDGVIWQDDFLRAEVLASVLSGGLRMTPTASWFKRYSRFNRFSAK
jgi:hypothetical protein